MNPETICVVAVIVCVAMALICIAAVGLVVKVYTEYVKDRLMVRREEENRRKSGAGALLEAMMKSGGPRPGSRPPRGDDGKDPVHAPAPAPAGGNPGPEAR